MVFRFLHYGIQRVLGSAESREPPECIRWRINRTAYDDFRYEALGPLKRRDVGLKCKLAHCQQLVRREMFD